MSKVGRNDPCPCGSGKKYKKCCEIKEQKKHEYKKLENVAMGAMYKQLLEGMIGGLKETVVAPKPEEKSEELKDIS